MLVSHAHICVSWHFLRSRKNSALPLLCENGGDGYSLSSECLWWPVVANRTVGEESSVIYSPTAARGQQKGKSSYALFLRKAVEEKRIHLEWGIERGGGFCHLEYSGTRHYPPKL